jgi:copper chaperone CopZ
MKTVLLIVAIALSVATKAQVTKVSLQASGLTCSMCSNSIYKALKTLDFVNKVETDIKTYTFEIVFKPNSNVDFDKIRIKVEKAGFSVSSFIATIHFDNAQIKNRQLEIGERTFVFADVEEQKLNGDLRIKILEKGFVSGKEYKRYSFSSFLPNTYHVSTFLNDLSKGN